MQNAEAKRNVRVRAAALTLNTTTVLVLAALGCAHAAPPAAGDLPANGTVVAGQATIAVQGAAMTINQSSQRAIVDWQSFNVGSAGSVNFNQQQGSSSVTLNRVVGREPSQIFGRISAPGQVFLVNPGGVYFSPSARVDVGGLVATTHAITNENFMAGRYLFERNGAQGSIINEGELKSAVGGYIALLAPEVRNQGVILAYAGTAALASGESFELQMQGQNTLAGVSVTPSTIRSLVENRLAVIAEGGLIILSARAADQLQGSVVNNSGSLVAKSLTEKGGRIVLTADTINLESGSLIDASGATGGGGVLVGGDFKGGGGIYQATRVSMAADATVDVSATQEGDGGQAVFWSDITKPDSLTSLHGLILARGAGLGGRGGQIETSGYRLALQGIRVNAGAPSGRGGSWLLDPVDITIDDDPLVGDAPAAAISAALNGGTDVLVDTFGSPPCFYSCSGNGDIFINTSINGTGGAPSGTLSILAERNVTLASGVSITNDNTVQVVAGRFQMAGNGAGGNIILNGNNLISAPLVLLYSGSPLDASLGNLINQLGGTLLYNLDSSYAGPASGIYGFYRAPAPTPFAATSILVNTTSQPYLPVLSNIGISIASQSLLATLDLSPLLLSAGVPQLTALPDSAAGESGEAGTGIRVPASSKTQAGIMLVPPKVPGFKRAYVVLLNNPDGTTGQIIVVGERGKQVVSSAGFGVPLDGSALPQKVGDQLMEQDFASARKAIPNTGKPRGTP